MKKAGAALAVLLAPVLCSCTAEPSSYVNELMQNRWIAQTDGGGEAELAFEGSIATLALKSGGTEKEISGNYIADESSFVIFVPSLSYNYKFDYTPSGNSLELTYNGMTINFEAAQ